MYDSTTDQPFQFRTENWVEVNDDADGNYFVNWQTKFKTRMLESSFCDYSDIYILVKRAVITGAKADATAQRADKRIKQDTLKHCAPFASCLSEIKNTEVDNAKYLHVITNRISSSVLLMCHLIECSRNY